MRATLPKGKWRKRLKIKAFPPFTELHKVRDEKCKIFLRNIIALELSDLNLRLIQFCTGSLIFFATTATVFQTDLAHLFKVKHPNACRW